MNLPKAEQELAVKRQNINMLNSRKQQKKVHLSILKKERQIRDEIARQATS